MADGLLNSKLEYGSSGSDRVGVSKGVSVAAIAARVGAAADHAIGQLAAKQTEVESSCNDGWQGPATTATEPQIEGKEESRRGAVHP